MLSNRIPSSSILACAAGGLGLRFHDFSSSGRTLGELRQQPSFRQHQICQSKQHEQLGRVLRQAPIAGLA
jgi:hypothetical protein